MAMAARCTVVEVAEIVELAKTMPALERARRAIAGARDVLARVRSPAPPAVAHAAR